MATIANASSAYVSVGNGATPVKIYDNANNWVRLNDTNSNTMFFHNNGDGTAKIVGGTSNGTLTLPQGIVANGYQTFSNGWSNANTINDGSNQMSLGLYYPNGYGNPIDNYQIVNWTINIRTTN